MRAYCLALLSDASCLFTTKNRQCCLTSFLRIFFASRSLNSMSIFVYKQCNKSVLSQRSPHDAPYLYRLILRVDLCLSIEVNIVKKMNILIKLSNVNKVDECHIPHTLWRVPLCRLNSTNVSDGQTDRQTDGQTTYAIARPRFAL